MTGQQIESDEQRQLQLAAMRPKQFSYFVLPILLFLLSTIIAIFAVTYSGIIGRYTSEKLVRHVDAVSVVKFEMSQTHLWLEEFLSGDLDEGGSSGPIWQHFSRGEWYLQSLQFGGENDKGYYPPVDDRPTQSALRILQNRIEVYRQYILQRIQNRSTSKAGTASDKSFDQQFSLLLEGLTKVEIRLQQLMQMRLERFTSMQWWLILLLVLNLFGIIFVLWRNNRRIETYFKTLQATIYEADKANRAKTLFLANMSHELRTPMHGILSFASMGSRRIDTISQEKIAKYFENIHISGTRLLNLLNDLLDIAKLESGQMELRMQAGDIVTMFERCIAEQELRINELHLHVQIDNQLPAGLPISFDYDRITQVFSNLLGNAIKFSPAGGIISAKFALIAAPDAVDHNRCCQFTITDQGHGIDKDELESVFNKFAQSAKLKSGHGGTGLGLAICREILLAHQGKIWAEKREVGGCVCFTLPVYYYAEEEETQ